MHQENLTVIAGNTLTLDMELLDKNKEPVTDLVGAVAEMQVRENIHDDTTDFTTQGVITPETGVVQFTLEDAETSALLVHPSKSNYIYGCKITYSDNTSLSILSGRLTVKKGVVQ